MWVKRELLFALQQNHFADRISAILYRHCEFERLSWVLPIFQFVNFEQAFDDGCRELLRTWGLGYRSGRS